MGLTGLGLTSSLGQVTESGAAIVAITGLSMTSSTGVLVPADVMGLTGLSATASTGSVIVNQGMGLTGVSATASVSPIGVAPLGYETITATQTANYTAVNQGT